MRVVIYQKKPRHCSIVSKAVLLTRLDGLDGPQWLLV